MTVKTEQMPVVNSEHESGWIVGMREYHSRTGNYRGSDVIRLLGAPWERAEINLTSTKGQSHCVKT